MAEYHYHRFGKGSKNYRYHNLKKVIYTTLKSIFKSTIVAAKGNLYAATTTIHRRIITATHLLRKRFSYSR